MRIGSKVDEIFDSGKGQEESIKSTAADIANVGGEVQAIKAVVDDKT
jgi:hypothetical protein